MPESAAQSAISSRSRKSPAPKSLSPVKALPMNDSSFPYWEINLPAKAVIGAEYKFIVRDKTTLDHLINRHSVTEHSGNQFGIIPIFGIELVAQPLDGGLVSSFVDKLEIIAFVSAVVQRNFSISGRLSGVQIMRRIKMRITKQ